MDHKLFLVGLGSLVIVCLNWAHAATVDLHHHGDPGSTHHGHGQGHGAGGHLHFFGPSSHRRHSNGWDDSEYDSGNAGYVQKLIPIFQLGHGFSKWFYNKNRGSGWHMDDSSEHQAIWSPSGHPNPVPVHHNGWDR